MLHHRAGLPRLQRRPRKAAGVTGCSTMLPMSSTESVYPSSFGGIVPSKSGHGDRKEGRYYRLGGDQFNSNFGDFTAQEIPLEAYPAVTVAVPPGMVP